MQTKVLVISTWRGSTVGLHYDIYQKIKSVNVELCDPYNKVNTLESQHTRNNSPHMFVSRVLVSWNVASV